MIVDSLVLAAATMAGVLIIYQKLPHRIRNFITRYPVATDVITLFALYVFLGGTLVALLTAAICGILISLLLYVVMNKKKYPELNNLFETIKGLVSKMFAALNSLLKTLSAAA